ncbi:sigma-70 family RNA polymerase sigma factor [Pseudoflavitalea sp. G-6-1-2]|uniref:RNA polymerase sigma factor n=1 Tax=Pseudoflavitalea sp. G-6-1-2 TaxID=2728841 RepID=UPI00146D70AE|nr:sigma-70 family RNA polymerase sigma factor [Pseudoflavitalea sp. G-6-1-2]NML21170.1 sigma-70 family RNA polymerase sigma factor [Pseudoflavitalea sp. G-6-1-2]
MERIPLNITNDLFVRIADGEEAAFNEFYNLYLPHLTGYIYKLVKSEDAVKEVVQESLIRLWLHRDQLPEIQHSQAWFYRIVSNECYRYLRKSGLRMSTGSIEETPAAFNEGSTEGPEPYLAFRETQQVIHRVVAALSPRQQTIYRMSREEGMNLAEIAVALDLSRDYVKKVLITALQNIRKKLTADGRLPSILIFLLLNY